MNKKKPESLAIKIVDSSGKESSGTLFIHRWQGKEGFWRSVKIMAKIFGCVLCLCSVATVVHPLIIPSLTTLTLTLISAPILFSYWMGQEATFLYAEGKCPYCPYRGRLNRYLFITLTSDFTLLCPECGESFHGRLTHPDDLSGSKPRKKRSAKKDKVA